MNQHPPTRRYRFSRRHALHRGTPAHAARDRVILDAGHALAARGEAITSANVANEAGVTSQVAQNRIHELRDLGLWAYGYADRRYVAPEMFPDDVADRVASVRSAHVLGRRDPRPAYRVPASALPDPKHGTLPPDVLPFHAPVRVAELEDDRGRIASYVREHRAIRRRHRALFAVPDWSFPTSTSVNGAAP